MERVEIKKLSGETFCTVELDHTNQWIRSTWRGRVTEAEIAHLSVVIRNVLGRYQGYRSLTDQRALRVSSATSHSAHQAWTRVAQWAGCRRFARLLTERQFERLGPRELERTRADVVIKSFENEGLAKHWLRSAP